jgi:MFS family permease
MLLEGASIDWTAIYMDSVFEATPEMGAIGVATAALSQGMVRYFGDRFVDRFAPTPVARGMQTIMALGIITVFFAPDPLVALAGFALIGAGNAMMFPLAMSAAAQRTDRPAAINVAALAQFSFVTFLLAPPLLGFIAEHFGLRWTFGIGLPLVILSFSLSGALGSKPAKAFSASAVNTNKNT